MPSDPFRPGTFVDKEIYDRLIAALEIDAPRQRVLVNLAVAQCIRGYARCRGALRYEASVAIGT